MRLQTFQTRTPILLVVSVCVSLMIAGCNAQSKLGRSGSPGPTDPDAPAEYTTTDSGLKYRILRMGDGRKPTAADTVVVDYMGTLDSNIEFDNSYSRRDPSSFPLRNVVAGWTEGLQYVSEGGMIELVVPPELGYGDNPRPGIPIGSTLHFQIELIEIK